MAYAAKRKAGMSVVQLCSKKDWDTALERLAQGDPKLADVHAVDEQGWTPLHHAASNGRAQLVERLLEARADPNSTGTFGSSPLHVAALNGKQAQMRALVAAGADVNARDTGGRTALIEAARWGKVETAKLLLELGADKSIKNEAGFTAADLSNALDGKVAAIL